MYNILNKHDKNGLAEAEAETENPHQFFFCKKGSDVKPLSPFV